MKFIYNIALLFFVVVFYSCNKSVFMKDSDGSFNGKNNISTQCLNDKDCAAIKADCCGCMKGGKQRAVPREDAKKILDSFKDSCSQIACVQMISKDESCKKMPVCLDGECVLQ